ncbi:hypothetical protein HQQ94_20675 [Shewanella sp. VB17]|uniref:hypothetical protein n=1 Tax=Shewanella sp. VB17 TaxID=2739432 RepID=UPI001567213C|nr:hypothetical protein [Shewanella sp. VB17]NRD75589.1 hypothetical protein [Shewanella sp. VB17]
MLEITGVDTAVAVDSMDAVVELTRTYLQRATEISAHTPLEAINKSQGTTFNIPPNITSAKR